MNPLRLHSALGPYALATGEAAADRPQILHGLYGAGTRRVLLGSGLRRGMRVADLGCGAGTVTALLAELVGPAGRVVGLDASAAQLAAARERLNGGGRTIRFVEASATDTGLPPGSFDLVYCRFLLLHLPEPDRALREMRALLRPDGVLVCEDGDLTADLGPGADGDGVPPAGGGILVGASEGRATARGGLGVELTSPKRPFGPSSRRPH
jgi:SAM-dependent methyltransferase